MLLADRPLPELSLGWGVLDWCSTYLAQPDGANKGATWQFTNEQARFLVHFYAVDDHGKFLYRRAILERVKGWGKALWSPPSAAPNCWGLSTLMGSMRTASRLGDPFQPH